MTSRLQRFRRLVQVRSAQHAYASASLSSERDRLEHSVRSMEQLESSACSLVSQGREALGSGDRREWLLANAALQLHSIELSHNRKVAAHLQVTVREAEAAESAARMQLRQSELLLVAVQTDERTRAARAEQKMLDEATQMVRARSSNTRIRSSSS